MSGFNNIIVFISVIVASVVALHFHDRRYTLVTAVLLILVLVYLHFVAKVEWISQASFTFFILMPGFFPVNGILTGMGIESPIVNYNNQETLNFRVLTIPIEDFVFGYAQFILVLYFFLRKSKFSPAEH